ncbi:MAG: metallopeptidase family protein [Thermomicrobiales bacterium]
MVQFGMRDVRAARLRRVKRRRFELLVRRGLRLLPEPVQRKLDNVAIVVEDEPANDRKGQPEPLFGLYEGQPLTERGGDYSMILPDKITLYRVPLEDAFPDRLELARQVRITLIHELAHHFGIDEDRIEELGWQ